MSIWLKWPHRNWNSSLEEELGHEQELQELGEANKGHSGGTDCEQGLLGYEGRGQKHAVRVWPPNLPFIIASTTIYIYVHIKSVSLLAIAIWKSLSKLLRAREGNLLAYL